MIYVQGGLFYAKLLLLIFGGHLVGVIIGVAKNIAKGFNSRFFHVFTCSRGF